MKKIGFIGAGNMGGAILGGIVNSGIIDNEHVIASAKSDKTLERIKNEYKVNVTKDSKEVARFADLIVVAVKPNVYDEVLEEIKDEIDKEKIVITIAAGKTIESVQKIIGTDKKITAFIPEEMVTAVGANNTFVFYVSGQYLIA